MEKIKKNIKIVFAIFIITFLLLVSNLIIHCIRIDRFNSVKRTIKSSEEQKKVYVDIHPRGNKTDSWPSDYSSPEENLFGTVYEISVSNNTGYEIRDWALRINVYQSCYINNAWCGKVEIHQNVDGQENVQTLDLRNCDETDITLKYEKPVQDILIPLNCGDYFIYYPSEIDHENPIGSTEGYSGRTNSGFIIYSYGEIEGFNYADYTFEYYMNKKYLEGTEPTLFMLLLPFWAGCFIIYIISTALWFKYEKRLKDKDKTVIETIDVVSGFVDAKDPYTRGHSNRVAIYSKLIAQKLGFSMADCKNIYYMGLLHDVGKCYIPDEILKKPANLTAAQIEIIKKHTISGAEMLKNFTSIPKITNGVLYHHERFDGKGYPTGISGKDIPIEGRIVCVADAFDAMNSDRCYRKKLSKSEIVEELQKNSGSQFDPMVVDAFLEVISEENGIEF